MRRVAQTEENTGDSLVAKRSPSGTERKPLVVDLYAGAGGLTEGFLRAGFEVGIAVDSDHWATETQRVNHSSRGVEVIEADISSHKTYVAVRDRLQVFGRPISVLIGGPPCRGFSMSNVQTRAKGNPHNEQVFTFIQYVRQLRPEIFLMENVPGLDFFDDGKLKLGFPRIPGHYPKPFVAFSN